MKSCARIRKQIAWQAIEGADFQQDQELQAHLESCPRCRAYLAEMSGVTDGLKALELDSNISAPDEFHRKTLASLRACEKRPVAGFSWRGLFFPREGAATWRMAAPALAIAAVLVAFLITNRPWQHSSVTPASKLPPSVLPSLASSSAPAPTVANYEMAAGQSLEKLDEMIARQARKNPAPDPVYTAAAFPRWLAAE